MSTVVFERQIKPEKKLVQEIVYGYHPDSLMKAQILKEVEEHVKHSLEGFIVEVNIKVSLKEYDTKNTGI